MTSRDDMYYRLAPGRHHNFGDEALLLRLIRSPSASTGLSCRFCSSECSRCWMVGALSRRSLRCLAICQPGCYRRGWTS